MNLIKNNNFFIKDLINEDLKQIFNTDCEVDINIAKEVLSHLTKEELIELVILMNDKRKLAVKKIISNLKESNKF